MIDSARGLKDQFSDFLRSFPALFSIILIIEILIIDFWDLLVSQMQIELEKY